MKLTSYLLRGDLGLDHVVAYSQICFLLLSTSSDTEQERVHTKHERVQLLGRFPYLQRVLITRIRRPQSLPMIRVSQNRGQCKWGPTFLATRASNLSAYLPRQNYENNNNNRKYVFAHENIMNENNIKCVFAPARVMKQTDNAFLPPRKYFKKNRKWPPITFGHYSYF